MMYRRFSPVLVLALAACAPGAGILPDTTASSSPAAASGWSEASHLKGAKADYAMVFPQDKVAEFRITVTPENWQKMLDDMTKNYGARGAQGQGGQMGGPPPGGLGGPRPDRPASGAAGPIRVGGRPDLGASGGAFPPGGGMGGPGGMSREQPMWVPATITYNGKTWEHVGFRFKGNSSLTSAWRGGTDKIPFKLDFNEFGKEFPEVKDQRFYGFKQLSLSTNWSDASYMREAISYDILEQAGLPAAETSFYRVVLDRGAGESSLGIYTAIEVVDDTVVKRVFGGDKGNIYEGDGQAVTLAEGTRGQLSGSFQKENNEDAADWSDVEKLYDALHAKTRTTDATAWRAGLEAVFDVDGFLHWLAIAAILQHWDTYGGMTHNFYLYDNPANNRLTWISWDHNLVLGAQGGPGGGRMDGIASGPPIPFPPGGLPDMGASGAMPFPPGGLPDLAASGAMRPGGMMGGPGGRSTSFDRKDVAASWPLIRFLLDDPTYYARYVAFMKQTLDGPMQQDALLAKYQRLAALLKPYAEGQFDTAVQALSDTTRSQLTGARAFVEGR